MMNMAKSKRIRTDPAREPQTGVGTPDEHAQPAGLALGGDTGDVGTPRGDIGGSPGGTHGTSGVPEGSTVWTGGGKPLRERREELRDKGTRRAA